MEKPRKLLEIKRSLQTRFQRDEDVLIDSIYDKCEELREKAYNKDKIEYCFLMGKPSRRDDPSGHGRLIQQEKNGDGLPQGGII